ncbi:hypothetical protein CYMTET_30742, partial [Cymbomonas tetramitiformis]
MKTRASDGNFSTRVKKFQAKINRVLDTRADSDLLAHRQGPEGEECSASLGQSDVESSYLQASDQQLIQDAMEEAFARGLALYRALPPLPSSLDEANARGDAAIAQLRRHARFIFTLITTTKAGALSALLFSLTIFLVLLAAANRPLHDLDRDDVLKIRVDPPASSWLKVDASEEEASWAALYSNSSKQRDPLVPPLQNTSILPGAGQEPLDVQSSLQIAEQ